MTTTLRRLALQQQGLGAEAAFGTGIDATRRAIEHLGYVQIDTIAVVERAHHHVLWNRVPDYEPAHLNRLLREQQIFEYWYHAASYLPIRDYRFALPQMISIQKGENRYFRNADPQMMREILARVKAEGELRMRDLDSGKGKGDGNWWNWGAGRRAVEQLYMQGELMVCERDGMQKIYNLAERCLPSDLDLSVPSLYEYAEYLLNTTLRAHGVCSWKQLIHLKVGKEIREAMRQVLNERIDAGIIKAVKMDHAQTLYVDVAALDAMPVIQAGLKILSPFDNLVIHRDRLSALFNFDYKIECYVPAAKRVYGYFCLPILYGDRMLGRIDCKAQRARQTLEVLSLHLDTELSDQDDVMQCLQIELQRFAEFNACLSIWSPATIPLLNT